MQSTAAVSLSGSEQARAHTGSQRGAVRSKLPEPVGILSPESSPGHLSENISLLPLDGSVPGFHILPTCLEPE